MGVTQQMNQFTFSPSWAAGRGNHPIFATTSRPSVRQRCQLALILFAAAGSAVRWPAPKARASRDYPSASFPEAAFAAASVGGRQKSPAAARVLGHALKCQGQLPGQNLTTFSPMPSRVTQGISALSHKSKFLSLFDSSSYGPKASGPIDFCFALSQSVGCHQTGGVQPLPDPFSGFTCLCRSMIRMVVRRVVKDERA
jgi:hypothetical protein